MKVMQGSSGQIDMKELLQLINQLQVSDLEKFTKKALQLLERKKSPDFAKKEREEILIEKIKNGGPSQEYWKKHDDLVLRMARGTMTEAENKLLMDLLPISEQWTYDRLEMMIELSEIWGTSVDKVMERLNISPAKTIYA